MVHHQNGHRQNERIKLHDRILLYLRGGCPRLASTFEINCYHKQQCIVPLRVNRLRQYFCMTKCVRKETYLNYDTSIETQLIHDISRPPMAGTLGFLDVNPTKNTLCPPLAGIPMIIDNTSGWHTNV